MRRIRAQVLGPYCCAQFTAKREAILARPIEFYERMLRMVDGSIEIDLCTTNQVQRDELSTEDRWRSSAEGHARTLFFIRCVKRPRGAD